MLCETLASYKVIDTLIAYYLADARRSCRVLTIQVIDEMTRARTRRKKVTCVSIVQMLGALGSLLQQSSARRSMALAMPTALATDVLRLSNGSLDVCLMSRCLITRRSTQRTMTPNS